MKNTKSLKNLALAGIIIFSLMLINNFIIAGEISDPLDDFESLSGYASLFIGNSLSDFTDNIWELLGQSIVASIFGLVMSVIMYRKAKKEDLQNFDDMNSQLLKLSELRDKGALSEDEYEAKKREMLK